jgi:insulysin
MTKFLLMHHVGNWNTLEVKPKEKGLDTRLELISFYDSHYSANLMQLVVYGKGFSSDHVTTFFILLQIHTFPYPLTSAVFAESLDNIQTLVESKFCDIKNAGRKPFCFPGHPCSSKDLQVLFA